MTVSWKDMEAPKALGGLGFGNIKMMNLGLLSKWWWKFSTQSNPLWKQVVMSISGSYSHFCSLSQFPIGPWIEVAKGCSTLAWFNDIISCSFTVQVGNKARTLFWHDLWTHNTSMPLKKQFSTLYSLSTHQFSTIQEMKICDWCLWSWEIKWRRPLFQWEEDLIGQLHQRLAGCHLKPQCSNTFSCSLIIQGYIQ